jgi:hypothetical protein
LVFNSDSGEIWKGFETENQAAMALVAKREARKAAANIPLKIISLPR